MLFVEQVLSFELTYGKLLKVCGRVLKAFLAPIGCWALGVYRRC